MSPFFAAIHPAGPRDKLWYRYKADDMKSSAVDWYARVPTCAKWGDGSSRLEFADVHSLGCVESVVEPLCLAKRTGVNVLELLAQ